MVYYTYNNKYKYKIVDNFYKIVKIHKGKSQVKTAVGLLVNHKYWIKNIRLMFNKMKHLFLKV